MKRLLIPAALLLLAGCNQTAEPEALAAVSVTDATCRPTLNGRDVTGCYVTLTASRNDRLVSVAAPLAGLAQIHEMKVEDGVMKMAELKDGLALPAGEAVALKPGGDHIMLMGLKQPLAAGEQISITLNFEHAQPIGIRAVVAQPPIAGAEHAAH
jgi:copper(I)-binding protein